MADSIVIRELRQLCRANPITWHVEVLRYATIGVAQPAAFPAFTAVAFGGALWALKGQ